MVFSLGRVGAQTEDEKWNLGIHGGATQYRGDLGNGWYATDQAAYGHVGFSVSRYLSERFDANLYFTRGEAGHQAPRDFTMSEDVNFNFRIALSTLNLTARYHLFNREAIVNPYLFAGASVIRQQGNGSHHMGRLKNYEYAAPTGGIGFHIRLNPIVAIQVQETFMYTSADDIDYRVNGLNDAYLMHSIGITFNLEKRQMFEAGPSKKLDKCPRMKTGTQMKRGEGKGKLYPRKRAKSTFV